MCAPLLATLIHQRRGRWACRFRSRSVCCASLLESISLLCPWDDRRKLGWRHVRTPRGRAIASDEEVRRTAELINRLVDLPFWEEEQEQELFEAAVSKCLEAIAENLPPPFFDLLHRGAGCLDEESGELLSSNLVALCRQRVELPYLDEQDKRRIIRAVTWIVVDSLKEGCNIMMFVSGRAHATRREEMIVQVFMAGAMDVFFDEGMRKAMIQDVTRYVFEFPLLPHSLVEDAAEQVIKLFSTVLEDSLKEAYTVYSDHLESGRPLPVLPSLLKGDKKERRHVMSHYRNQPFLIQLRRIFINQLVEKEIEALPFLPRLPRRAQAKFLSWFVDGVFDNLPGLQKIEHSFSHRTALELQKSRDESQSQPCRPEPKPPNKSHKALLPMPSWQPPSHNLWMSPKAETDPCLPFTAVHWLHQRSALFRLPTAQAIFLEQLVEQAEHLPSSRSDSPGEPRCGQGQGTDLTSSCCLALPLPKSVEELKREQEQLQQQQYELQLRQQRLQLELEARQKCDADHASMLHNTPSPLMSAVNV